MSLCDLEPSGLEGLKKRVATFAQMDVEGGKKGAEPGVDGVLKATGRQKPP